MDVFRYFGYASNLDTSTLEGRLQSNPRLIGQGVLLQHGFRFNFPSPDGSARANLVPSPNESVYGLLFEIEIDDFDYFLSSEPGYVFAEVEILTKKGKQKAYTFISNSTQENIFPKKEYLETILNGGQTNGIPKGYLASIINRAGMIY